MTENTFLYAAFLIQVLAISVYFPRKFLNQVRYVIEAYPPSSYPKLYPVPVHVVERGMRIYRLMNVIVVLVGLAILGFGVYSPGEDLLNWDSQTVIAVYFVLQVTPLLLASIGELKYFALMRKAALSTTRKAELRPRRLFDFISPAFVGAAILTYVAFVSLVLYFRYDPFPGFGGAWNIVYVTVLNLFVAGTIAHLLSRKRIDPHQANDDRLRQIELLVKSTVFVSVAVTVFLSITLVLSALDLRNYISILMCLYLVVIITAAFHALRLDSADFEVYRGERLAT